MTDRPKKKKAPVFVGDLVGTTPEQKPAAPRTAPTGAYRFAATTFHSKSWRRLDRATRAARGVWNFSRALAERHLPRPVYIPLARACALTAERVPTLLRRLPGASLVQRLAEQALARG